MLEEVGYKIKDKNIIHCMPAFSSTGLSGERIYFFIATVTNKDKISQGGGEDSETERIEIVEMPYLMFANMVNDFSDLKTRSLAYEAHFRKIFDKK